MLRTSRRMSLNANCLASTAFNQKRKHVENNNNNNNNNNK